MNTRDDALRRLQGNWGELYEITEALGVWRAVKLLNGWTSWLRARRNYGP